MATPVKFIPNGDYDFFEIDGGRDDTKWFHVIEFDDGSTERFEPGDPLLTELLAEIENANEAAASRYYEAGRDFSGHYEP